ncbi:MAG TPA: flagellar motor switch phosphatase FliY [Ruminococcaceae bacterium]|nr:flagellar motor switch phosphatase FliY [Oscillospiraceae bacterium]
MTSILDDNNEGLVLSEIEIDTIGEILNISMGSAATAISTMLDKKVTITTPQVKTSMVGSLEYSALEPALCVEITYIEGVEGSNVMVFKQGDVKLILDQLMGNQPSPPDENFEFDEMSISAACEVMNQMMGASATALSNFLGKPINISTPRAYLLDNVDLREQLAIEMTTWVTIVTFNLNIEGIMDSEFMSIISIDLAKEIIKQSLNFSDGTQHVAGAQHAASQPQPAPQPAQQPQPQAAPQMPPPQPQMQQMSAPQQPQAQQPYPPQYPYPPQGGAYPPPNPMYPQGAYPPYPPQGAYPPPYGYYQPPVDPYAHSNIAKQQDAVNVKNIAFDEFKTGNPPIDGLINDNLNLIMSVPLQVTVEIGKTKKKIKEILDFTQGTIIELEKQAGSPVDIIVNGQLIARGDVVVIDDNFAVRVTEILKSKELLENI